MQTTDLKKYAGGDVGADTRRICFGGYNKERKIFRFYKGMKCGEDTWLRCEGTHRGEMWGRIQVWKKFLILM